MNKKEYIKPFMEIDELVSEVMMNAGSANGGINIGNGSFDSSSDDQYSNHRRGQWGNLWSGE